ncbi:MAG TPA: hypothetical protein DCS93_13245 [Microscillaceae bacterium]|nr:hypothetical protein [Microscillaceae bacterium]
MKSIVTKKNIIEQLLQPFDQNNSPGLALGIIQKEAFVFKKCLGLANLEDQVPITSQTVFDVGSMAKQFTAACVALLIEQGEVLLEDGIEQFFPQMPDYGHSIKLKHLIYHTSGLQDYLELAYLKGLDDYAHYDADFALQLIFSQPILNFIPGSEERYSNTNYLLLGQIVQLVSGQSLRQFAADNIFTPLGMHQTFFQDNANELVPHRAIGYAISPADQVEKFVSGSSVVGDGGLCTSLDDLLKWDHNFYHNQLGEKKANFNDLLLTPGILNDGTRFDYGFGLLLGNYKGVFAVRHGGAFAGYCAEMIRFPQEQLSIVCLANRSALAPWTLVEQVANILFDFEQNTDTKTSIHPSPNSFEPLKNIPKTLLEQYIGYYDLGAASPLEIIQKEEKLLLKYGAEDELTILPKTPQVFLETNYDIEIQFVNFQPDKKPFLVFKTAQQEIIAAKIPAPNQVFSDLTTYTGDYYCASLKVVYCLFMKDNALYLSIDFGKPMSLHFSEADFAETILGILRFFRDSQQQVTGFWLNAERTDHLEFIKLP